MTAEAWSRRLSFRVLLDDQQQRKKKRWNTVSETAFLAQIAENMQ